MMMRVGFWLITYTAAKVIESIPNGFEDFNVDDILNNKIYLEPFIKTFFNQSVQLKGVKKITNEMRLETKEQKIKEDKEKTVENFLTEFGIDQNAGVDLDLTAIPNKFSMAQTRKFKHVASIILYLQQIPILGKYVFYGCYCFANAQYDLDAGFGEPVDSIDRSCKNFHQCYKCIQKDFVKENGQKTCDGTDRSYRFRGFVDPVTQQRQIECTNDLGTCKRSICECDKRLAEELRDEEFTWNILHHERWGGFDKESECRRGQGARSAKFGTTVNEQRCCGQYPDRYLYVSKSSNGESRSCCNGKTYDLDGPLVCCENQKLVPAGNCLPGDVTIDVKTKINSSNF